ncbi:spore coat associated protein CotJA [Acetonema longum]|uniref:spore coat associated protein CotJA n=1 Tax=Acetonema longum TaxID=2374 RepID=UPI001EE67FEC|nr:spore coat associated protein CotJA [Acetonema longum]
MNKPKKSDKWPEFTAVMKDMDHHKKHMSGMGKKTMPHPDMGMEPCLDEMSEGMHHGSMHAVTDEAHIPSPVLLAHAYVPWQCYTKAFSPQEALKKGTLFPELYGPYQPPL